MSRYREVSQQIHAIFQQCPADLIEPISLDEA